MTDTAAAQIVRDIGFALDDIPADLLALVPPEISFYPVRVPEGPVRLPSGRVAGHTDPALRFRVTPIPPGPLSTHTQHTQHAHTFSLPSHFPCCTTELYAYKAACFPQNALLLHQFSLTTRAAQSVYRQHALAVAPESPACCAECAPRLVSPLLLCGENQCDLTRLTAPSAHACYVSLSPAERAQTPADAAPYFRALAAEHIGVVVDLATEYGPGPFAHRCDYLAGSDDGDDYEEDVDSSVLAPLGLAACTVLETHACADGARHTFRLCTCSRSGHRFVHAKSTCWADLSVVMPEELIAFFGELDRAVAAVRAEDAHRVAAHCNGGLGRAPTLLCCRAVWDAARLAHAQGVPRLCDWKLQRDAHITKRVKDARTGTRHAVAGINLAHVARNALLRGFYCRSTFVQSEVQYLFIKSFTVFMTQHNFADTE